MEVLSNLLLTLYQHFLLNTFSFWVRRGKIDTVDYEKSIKLIYTFNTVEEFWILYDHTIRPSEVSYPCDYHLFRKGVKPMWEDKENVNGGSFVIKIPHSNKVSRYWEDLVLAFIGGQFDGESDEICGLVFSTRYQKDIISIWCKYTEPKVTKKIQENIRRVLGMTSHFLIDFKYHNQALKISSVLASSAGESMDGGSGTHEQLEHNEMSFEKRW